MNILDLLAISAYFVLVLSAGFWYRSRAAKSLNNYFLGGRRINWAALAMSGSVTNFDITGTMWMVSVLYLLGMQSWWHHWMWGVALPAFSAAYMARWVRRSRVMTAAEWMVTRFGPHGGGMVARYAAAILAVLMTVGMIAYAFQGIGKFAAVYIPLESLDGDTAGFFSEHEEGILATAVFAITTLYVALGGLYSVVVTDVIQTIILTGASIIIAIVAYINITPELMATHVPEGFARLAPQWRIERFAGSPTPEFEFFGLMVIVWVAQGLIGNAAGPAQNYDFQRMLAAPSERDACKLAAAWPFFLIIRWAMVAGIALLAMTGAVSASDPEKVMPIVLHEYLPMGVRGIVIAGLLAAFMSTFSSTVNAGASFIVRDIWQPLFAKDANQSQLVRAGYVSTVGIVIVGVLFGFQADSISQVWTWLLMALGPAAMIPNFIRWYWWRFNGWAFAGGIAGGIAVMALLELLKWREVMEPLPLYLSLPTIAGGSAIACIVVSFVAPQTDRSTLESFYRSVRPFGVWGAVRRGIEDLEPRARGEGFVRAMFNAFIAIVGITGLYLGPMYLVGHWHLYAAICASAAIGAFITLYFTWYLMLPPPERTMNNPGSDVQEGDAP